MERYFWDMKIRKVSVLSGKLNERDIPISLSEFIAGETRRSNGELIQDVYPQLSADDREFLMSGLTPEEFDETMGLMKKYETE